MKIVDIFLNFYKQQNIDFRDIINSKKVISNHQKDYLLQMSLPDNFKT
jgi:hypothetical protein